MINYNLSCPVTVYCITLVPLLVVLKVFFFGTPCILNDLFQLLQQYNSTTGNYFEWVQERSAWIVPRKKESYLEVTSQRGPQIHYKPICLLKLGSINENILLKMIQSPRQTDFLHRPTFQNFEHGLFPTLQPLNLQVQNTWTISESEEFEGQSLI